MKLKNSVLALFLASSPVMAFDFSTRYENDNDGAYKFNMSGRVGDYGAGVSHTINETSPFIMYKDYGVYFNKAPYLFFDKAWQFGKQTTVSIFLDSLDYKHTSDYSDELWFGGVSVGYDLDLTEKDVVALNTAVSGVSDGNWRQTSRVNYTKEFFDGVYGLLRYKNSTNSEPSEYYYSPKKYNSIQTGLMYSDKIGAVKYKIGATSGYFESTATEGLTSEAFLKVLVDKSATLTANFKYEEDYGYGMIGLEYSF